MLSMDDIYFLGIVVLFIINIPIALWATGPDQKPGKGKKKK